MARNKIDRAEELPKWFSLEHYPVAKSFNAAKWLEQLAVRKYLRWLLSQPRELVAELFTEQVEFTRGRPLEDASILFRSTRIATQELTAEKSAARLLTHRDLASLLRIIEPNDFAIEHADESISLPDFYQRDSRPKYALVRLDMDMTDAELTAALTAQLPKFRARIDRPKPKPRKRPPYDRWARYGLLPYLDLKLWEQETGKHIPLRVMADALAPLEIDEDRLKDTIAPLADGLMADLSALQALAIAESQGNF